MTRPGLAVYLDSHDVHDLDATIATLRRCGAVEALVLIESQDGRRQTVERVTKACAAIEAADIEPTVYSFPGVLADLGAVTLHAIECRQETGARGLQFDVEPLDGRQWTQARYDELLRADPDASVTTTRAVLASGLHLRGRALWLQMEAQTSTDHLDANLEKWPDAICVTGVFDAKGDERTVAEVRRDLDRCTAQAVRTGRHGVWSAHTLTPAKADALKAWALATW